MMKCLLSLILALLLTLTASCALANSWNLTGPLLGYVSSTHDYDAYTALVSADKSKAGVNTVAAFMNSPDRTLLLAGHRDPYGDWQFFECNYDVSSQDADAMPTLYCANDQLVITDALSSYAFQWIEGDDVTPAFCLVSADIGDAFRVTVNSRSQYIAEENGQTIIWYTGSEHALSLTNFDPRYFPRSSDEVRRMNTLHSLSEGWISPRNCAVPLELHIREKLPVYSAPDATSYRAANGKAAVSLNGSCLPLAGGPDGWVLIDYAVNHHTHRVGWVKDPRVTHYGGYISDEGLPVRLAGLSSLTDDPFLGCAPVVPVSELTNVRLLCSDTGIPWFCYVAAEWKGQTLWGFVPASAVQIDPGTLSSMLCTADIVSGGHHFACETDSVTFLDPVVKPLFDVYDFIMDETGRVTAVTGSYSTIIEIDCYAPFAACAQDHTYPLAADFVLAAPSDLYGDITENDAVYTDLYQFLIDFFGEELPAIGPDCGFTSRIELNENGEICYMEYCYVPWG